MAAMVTLGSFTVANQIKANLRGTVYRKGRLPVRKVSGRLYGALREKRESKYIKHIYMDKDSAPYAVFVQYGTRKLMKRDFFASAFKVHKENVIKLWKSSLKKRIRDYAGSKG
jgi:hypothetical protein